MQEFKSDTQKGVDINLPARKEANVGLMERRKWNKETHDIA